MGKPENSSDPVCVTFAVSEEARPFSKRAAAFSRVRIVVTGMGAANAEASVRAALELRQPRCVITSGFAGGLNPQLRQGQVVIEAESEFEGRDAFLEAGAWPGRFHCAPKVAVSPGEKAALWRETRADAVEMESGVVRALCRARSVPSATVRVISDAADEALPVDFNRLFDARFRIRYLRLAGELARSPRLLPALINFRKRVAVAAEELSKVLARGLNLPRQ